MADKETFHTLFENDYIDCMAILEKLVKPVFGEKVKARNKDLEVDAQDKDIISGIKIFADIGGAFPINFVDVTIKSKVKIRYNKVTVQRCVRNITNSFQSALIFFHYEDASNRNWRITFVNKGERSSDSTNPKRYTYLCGKNVSCRTAAERFEILKNEIWSGQKNLKDLMVNAFSVETVSNEFFEEYREHYADFVEYLSGNRYVKKGGAFVQEKTGKASKYYKEAFGSNDKAVRDYVKKLMGRLVFLQFLQKKGWMGIVEENKWSGGDKNFTNNLFKAASAEQKKNFLEAVLKPIFFNCLNKDRKDKGDKFDTGVSSIGKNGVVRIPYLNGGLFKSETEDETVVKFPEELFEKLFDFFSRYNFTIDESDPLDVEVGVDPEMLGKIFENLLEDNKDKGAFYTPKEIVNYMCRESLTAYLINNEELIINNGRENKRMRFTEKGYEKRIANFVQNPCKETAAILMQEELLILNYKLLIVKICDPAVGSGAFPMGLLNLLFNCRVALGDETPHSDLKKQIVQNNIYGVDIEKGAVDIARLRFWLAIVVDAEKPEPLPNLDYKIMQGNSLIESYKGIDLSVLTKRRKENDGKTSDVGKKTKRNEEYQNDLIAYGDDGKVADHIGELIKLLKEYYLPNDSKTKEKLKTCVNKMVQMILKDNMNDRKILAELEKMDLEATSEFFLWHLWFTDVFNRPTKDVENAALDCNKSCHSELVSQSNSGFDIVIGNPPYVEARNSIFSEELKDKLQENMNKIYASDANKFFPRGADLLIFFFELSIRLINNHGVIALITQNSWLNSDYGKKFQNFIIDNTEILAIVDSDFKYFETANINTVISFFKGKKAGDKISYARCHKNLEEEAFAIIDTNKKYDSTDIKIFEKNNPFLLNYKWGFLFFSDNEFIKLLEKAQTNGNKLSEKENGFSIGQGVNASNNNIYPIHKNNSFPIFMKEDGAIYNWQHSTMFVSKTEISRERKIPVLIMPRGIGSRYFCAFNSTNGYSASCVDIYSNKKNDDDILRLWIFCNSSFCWLMRENSGRKNLGGGMLKAEATDMKLMPLLYNFEINNKVKDIFEKAKFVEITTDIRETLENPIHKEIDEIVFSYLNFSESEKKYVIEKLISEVESRNRRSKT